MNNYINAQFEKLPVSVRGHVVKNQTVGEPVAIQLRLNGSYTNWVNISDEQMQAIYFVLNQD